MCSLSAQRPLCIQTRSCASPSSRVIHTSCAASKPGSCALLVTRRAWGLASSSRGESASFRRVQVSAKGKYRSKRTVPEEGSGEEGSGEGDEEEEFADEPITCAEAIEFGLEFFTSGDYKQAISQFQRVLPTNDKVLPGNGAMRFKGTVKEISCASSGEINSALYNMACCYAKLGSVSEGLDVMKSAFDNGFDDYASARTDPDLEPLRAGFPNKLNLLVDTYENLARLGGKKESDTNKAWWERW